MKKFVILWLLFVNAKTIKGQTPGQTPCEMKGCDNCIYRGPNTEAECVCPCPQMLAQNGATCEQAPCDVDLYALIDSTKHSDYTNCLIPFLNPTYTNWLSWRDTFVTFFSTFVNDTNIRTGLQLLGEQTLETQNTYSQSLQVGLDLVSSKDRPMCGVASYIRLMEQVVEVREVVANNPYNGPGPRRDNRTTTRVAIVGVAGYSLIQDDPAARFHTEVSSQFDRIIVISKDASDANADRLNRLVACGDFDSTSCKYLFYLDRENDFGLEFNRSNVDSVINYQACTSRRPNTFVIPNATYECGSNSIVVTVPKCALGGMVPNDLELLDTTCSINYVTDATGESWLVTVGLFDCGIISEIVGSSLRLTQVLSTRNYSADQVLPDITISMECSYPSPTPIRRPPATISGSFAAQGGAGGGDSVQMSVFSESSFSSAVNLSSQVLVGEARYFEINTDIPSNLRANLYSCLATSTENVTGEPRYEFISGTCVSDETFELVEVSGGTIRFKIDMFEFVQTFSEIDENKLPVFFYCSVASCIDSDTTDRCVCATRRRRSVDVSRLVSRSLISPMTELEEDVKSLEERAEDVLLHPEDRIKNMLSENQTVINGIIYVTVLIVLVLIALKWVANDEDYNIDLSKQKLSLGSVQSDEMKA
ncbi:unnamed protein product [Clavelina lepadiformis]|uniref:ZP domain-containing protein n=1 Tax=Clavelina lepadiformis TaxID=159417 RepID=A0ABP0G6K2_CLALP